MPEEELKNKTHLLIAEYIDQTMPDTLFERLVALFKQAGYVRLSPNQSLPENVKSDLQRAVYGEAQQDMTNDKYRRVEL